jgi:Tfp pilus assembly protein PilZ
MKHIFFSLLFFSILTQCATAQDIHSIQLSRPATIDGIPDEWPQPFSFYNGQTKLQYNIANDSANIYVCFKVTDEPAQMKMMRAGIDVWFDPKGKKKETTGIGFPMKQERVRNAENHDIQEENKAHLPGQTYQKHDFTRFKATTKSSQVSMKLTGFADVPNQVIGIANNTGIIAALNWDSLNILCIEYQIPIAKVLQHPFTTADTLKPIGIGFVVNAMPGANEPRRTTDDDNSDLTGSNINRGGMNNGMNSNMGGGMNTGVGGMNNTGMGQNMGSGMSYSNNSYNEALQEHKVWSRLILNYRP